MRRYVLKKIAIGFLTMTFSFCLTFFLIRSAPGNPVKAMAGTDNPSLATMEQLTEKYGLNESLPIQLYRYMGHAVKGDLGYSYLSDRPVAELIREKLGPTLLLTASALFLSLLVGTLLGIYAAKNTDSRISKILCNISYLFDSIPSFWLGLLLILIFASGLQVLPTAGMRDVRQEYTGIQLALDVLRHMALPVMTLVMIQSPLYFRVARVSVCKTLEEEYVTVLKATGMSGRRLFYGFALKNAILPTVTVLSSDLAFMIVGVSLVETVFAWPGMGRLLLEATKRRDYPLLTGIYLVLSISICIVMIITDFIYACLDPRIHFE